MKRDPKKYFRVVSNITIAINLIVGLTAIFLLQRIVPAMDMIQRGNAVALQASLSAQTAILSGDQMQFWKAIRDAEALGNIPSHKPVLEDLRELGLEFWSGDFGNRSDLLEKIDELNDIQLGELSKKSQEAKLLGLTGAWALGFLVVVSVLLQMVARRRIFMRLMEPIGELIAVLDDYQKGNRLRRFTNSDATEEVKLGGLLVNKLLDRDLHGSS